ncbi:hypothetical protein [Arenibacterium sp. LLYu02]|uniref:hypothetical protein n=1 Tax=Arenibacterium sp. LLYu02 TaxID=3404132 RepID=UPI003B220E9B
MTEFFVSIKNWLQSNGDWLASLAALATVATLLLERVRSVPIKVLREIRSLLASLFGHLTKPQSLVFIAGQHISWRIGERKERPTMWVGFRGHVTNNSDRERTLLAAKLSRKHPAVLVAVQAPDRNIFGSYAIKPGVTTEVLADFYVQPPFKREGRNFCATVTFMDNLGEEHVVRDVEFKADHRIKQAVEVLSEEAVSELNDPVEKKLVSILKDEVMRYSKNSRAQGGLGSIKLIKDGKERTQGLYQDGWTSSAAGTQQEIDVDPPRAAISSDNGDKLVACFASLEGQEEKEKFVSALLDRVDGKREYLGVTYMIVYVLLRIGHLQKALNTVEKKLSENRSFTKRLLRKFRPEPLLPALHSKGHSDVYALLNALLRWTHDAFSEEQLDAIERAVAITEEHTFRIPQKLNAIRAHRAS